MARNSTPKKKTRPMVPELAAAFERGRERGARETLSTVASAIVVGLLTWAERSAKSEPATPARPFDLRHKDPSGECRAQITPISVCRLRMGHTGPHDEAIPGGRHGQ